MSLYKYLFTVSLLLGSLSGWAFDRISQVYVNRSEVQRVYITPGKPLLIEFPCAVDFALPGTATDLEVRPGIKNKNNLTFWAHSMSDVIGVNVKCGHHVIIFDVIPIGRNIKATSKYWGLMCLTARRRL